MHYILFYDVAEDYVAKRTALRGLHFKHARAAYDCGELVLGGALGDPVDGAVIIFRVDGAAERFAASDPYVLHGLVRSWRVRKWNTVIGDGAMLP